MPEEEKGPRGPSVVQTGLPAPPGLVSPPALGSGQAELPAAAPPPALHCDICTSVHAGPPLPVASWLSSGNQIMYDLAWPRSKGQQ